MEKILDSLSANIEELEETDSPIAQTIVNKIQDEHFDENFNGVSMFVEEINEVKSNGEEIQEDTVNDVLQAMKDKLDHVAGQIDVSNRVIGAGAGPHKAAEYLQNASESLEDAAGYVDELVAYVTGEHEFSDGSLVSDSAQVEEAAVLARMDIENLKSGVEDAVEELTN